MSELDDMIGDVEKDLKKAWKEIKEFIENPKNVKEEKTLRSNKND